MVGCAAFAMSLGIFMVAERQQNVRQGYALSQLADSVRKIGEENRKLRLERAVLTDPARIEKLARMRGMRPVTSDQLTISRKRMQDEPL